MKLCYKEYPVKMSLNAIKLFKQHTGLDLWAVLLKYIEAFIETQNDPVVTRMRKLTEVADFETASYMFKALADNKDKRYPIEEFQDAMFRTGWMNNEDADEMSEPWPVVAVAVAYEVDSQLAEIQTKKKAAI